MASSWDSRPCITNMRIVQDPDVQGQVLVTFDWASKYYDSTEKYEASWWYITESGTQLYGATESKEGMWGEPMQRRFTWSYPETAVCVICRIWPIAVGTSSGNPPWLAKWVEVRFDVKASAFPAIPSTPDVSLRPDGKLRMTLDNINQDTSAIEFQIMQNDSTVYATAKVNVSNTRSVIYDKALTPGSSYRVRARAFKASGLSSRWSEFSSIIYSIPLAPTLTTCRTYSVNTENPTIIDVAWTANTAGVDKFRIEYTTDIQYFINNVTSQIQSVETEDYTQLSYQIDGLETGHEYYVRVASINDAGRSEYSEIKSVVLGATPSPPTTWTSASNVKVGDIARLFWVHNARDGSSQKTAQVIFSFRDGAYTETITLTNTTDPAHIDDTSALIVNTANGTYQFFDTVANFSVLTANVFSLGGTLKWSVKTAGVTGEYGEMSVLRNIDIYAAIDFTVSSSSFEATSSVPSYSLPSYPIDISAVSVIPDLQKPLSYYVKIVSMDSYQTLDAAGKPNFVTEDQIIFSRFYDDSGTISVSGGNKIYQKDISLSAGDVDLETGMRYKLIVSVAYDSAIEEVEEIDFRVEWEESIYTVMASVLVDKEQLTASIQPYCLTESETLASDTVLSVYRRNYDNTFTLIGDNVANDQSETVLDPHPRLDYASYRIVAMSLTNGGISYDDIYNIEVGEKCIVLQWDESWSKYYTDSVTDINSIEYPYAGSMLKLPWNIDISSSNSPDVASVEYIGRQHPVSYYGTQLGETASWSTDVVKSDTETLSKIRELMNYIGDVYVREPSGIGFWANVKLSYNMNHTELVVPVSIEITRVEGGI